MVLVACRTDKARDQSEKRRLEAAAVYFPPPQCPHVDALEHPHIECLDALVEARLDTFRHEAAPAARTEIVLHALLSESIFLSQRQQTLMKTISFITTFGCRLTCQLDK